MLFDSHAHINNYDMTPEMVDELADQIQESSLDYVMDIGYDMPSSEIAVRNAARFPWCYAAVGVHPHDTDTMNEEFLERIRELSYEHKVLGGWANIANEYATKRYRSNLINWGMIPFIIPSGDLPFANGDYIFIPDVRKAIEDKLTEIPAFVVSAEEQKPFNLQLGELTDDEREIILKGCLINYNRV